jgi:sterol desaturase/sphingolipid hydroxylase (fatty acid hydroxylase superfamily)
MYFIPLALMGFKPLDILFIYAATQVWGIFVHTKLINKLGWLEYFLVTPSHHRVHHASNAKYLDKNMGMFLIIWDKMFGTFQPELTEKEYQPIKYGLTKPIEKETPLTIIFHEWAQICSAPRAGATTAAASPARKCVRKKMARTLLHYRKKQWWLLISN